MRYLVALLACFLIGSVAPAADPSNLLRNGDFRDDWITLLPELKNHHWCFSTEFYHRRDFNPDGWTCKGAWRWAGADGPAGSARIVLDGPGEVRQRVNHFLVHDDRQLAGFPDAGGYPVMKSVRSLRPERLLKDLHLTLTVTGKGVAAKAASIELSVCPVGGLNGDPLGTLTPPIIAETVDIKDGPAEYKIVLPAAKILQAIKDRAAKDPKEAPLVAKEGWELPGLIQVLVKHQGKQGQVEIGPALLTTAATTSPQLLANAGFAKLDKGYPLGWSQPIKYRYFPPCHYYIFNTWHNANFPNRGHVAADSLIVAAGPASLRMTVPSGDETAVLSDPIVLNQKEPRLIEVSAVVRTDKLCMLQIDALDQDGNRLDGFNWIHKAPSSIGSDLRTLRQVFRPRAPVKSVRLALCARGVNGYTLDDTSWQPQNNVVGTVWWEKLHVGEPESAPEELKARGVTFPAPDAPPPAQACLTRLDLGERLLGGNVLRAVITNRGPEDVFRLAWEFTSPTGKKSRFLSPPTACKTGSSVEVSIPYRLEEPCQAYSEYQGRLSLIDGKNQERVAAALPFATWNTPIDVELGALYLRPDQKQFVRLNLGLAQATMQQAKTIQLDVIRRGSGQLVKSLAIDASPKAFATQKEKIPADLRDDFHNLLLADLDVSFLSVQAFADPQRNWFIRAKALDGAGKVLGQGDSQPFCRQAHEAPQPAATKVTIEGHNLYVNGQPWMPWGITYGHNAVYAGPADPGPGKYRDLGNIPEWSLYDRHGPFSTNRKQVDLNCLRYVAGSISDPKVVDKWWQAENLYCSTAFATPNPAFSLEDAFKQAGGKDKLDAYLAWCRTNPAVISVTPGIEEAFGLFVGATPQQLDGMGKVVDYLRQGSGKPVMVGHGGYWNRLEFERVPYYDIYDPETEPLYPANLHTDLAPLLKGKNKAVWLRPQMYESIPYERWRFHVFVELMRGARGWQIAHGPGDSSLFRGLHGELEFFKPIAYSKDAGPAVKLDPALEHWSRKHQGKTYIVAASTHGIPLGHWTWDEDAAPGDAKSRVSHKAFELRDETNAYAIGEKPQLGPAIHGIQYLPDARVHPAGSKLVQWVKLDAKDPPRSLAILVKGDGRWTHAAGWGKVDLTLLKSQPLAYWFLNSFYRHAKGFLGWGTDLVPKALEFVPDKANDRGALPKPGEWIKLEVPLKDIGADGKLIDGVGFLHPNGRVLWGKSAIVTSDGKETILWHNDVALPQVELAKVKIHVAGLKKGTAVRVLFEDRQIVADDGFFLDDCRGTDLYQRYGGGYGVGYGDAPVALRLYEVP